MILVIFLTACHSFYKLPNSKPESEIKQEKIDKKVRKKINKNEYYLKKLQTNGYDTPFTKRYIVKTSVGTFNIDGARADGYLKDGVGMVGFIFYYSYHNTTKKNHKLQTSIIDLLTSKYSEGKFIKDFPMYHGMDPNTYEEDKVRHENGNKYIEPGKSANAAVGYFAEDKKEYKKKQFYYNSKLVFEMKADPESTISLGKIKIPGFRYFD